jgi:hypothetical protein
MVPTSNGWSAQAPEYRHHRAAQISRVGNAMGLGGCG